MLYVPVIPPHAPPPSPRTRELAGLLGRVIEEYEKSHPAITGGEVRAAVHLAVQQSSRKGSPIIGIVAGLALTAALGGVFAFVAANQGKVSPEAMPMVVASLVVVLALAVVAVRVSRGR